MRSIILKHSNKIKNTCTPKKAVLQALFHFRMVGFGRRGSGIDSGKINSTLIREVSRESGARAPGLEAKQFCCVTWHVTRPLHLFSFFLFSLGCDESESPRQH